MILSKTNRTRINLVILSISVAVWIVLLINPGHIMTMEHCHVSASGPSATSLKMLLAMNPFSSQLLGWVLMVVAMMLPKLIVPIQGIYVQSLRRYRFWCSLLFVAGYIATWTAGGVFMVWVIIGLNLLMPMSYVPGLALMLIAIVWQFSPAKQRFLNQGHEHHVLSPFGWPAFRDSFMYGVAHGLSCIGSGWALMLFPMLLPKGHDLAMIIVTFIMISEHLEYPRSPKWRFDLRGKLFRVMVAQAQIKLKQLRVQSKG